MYNDDYETAAKPVPRRCWPRTGACALVLNVVVGLLVVVGVITLTMSVLAYVHSSPGTLAQLQSLAMAALLQVAPRHSSALYINSATGGVVAPAQTPLAMQAAQQLIRVAATLDYAPTVALRFAANVTASAALPQATRVVLWVLEYNATLRMVTHAPGSPYTLCASAAAMPMLRCVVDGTFTQAPSTDAYVAVGILGNVSSTPLWLLPIQT